MPDAPAPDASGTLKAYVAANAGTFTDEAITAALLRAGYPADDIRVALAESSKHLRPNRAAPKAVRAILIAYVATFLVLSAGMLLNSGRLSGEFMPSGMGGIAILAVSLVVVFGLSMIWVASRRAFLILILVLLVGPGISSVGGGGASTTLGLAILVVALGGIAFLALRRGTPGGGQTAIAVLLAVPILLLLVVAGICVGSGLPFPLNG